MVKDNNFEKVKVVLETSPRMKSKDIKKITNLSIVTISKILKNIENNYCFTNVKLVRKDELNVPLEE